MRILISIIAMSLLSDYSLASTSGVCVNSRNRDKANQVKMALSNGLLSSLETAELHMAETCRDYDRKLQELLDLSNQRSHGPAQISGN